MQKSGTVLLAAGFLTCVANAALASVIISSDATADMSCANGVCAPTAREAVLNVGDLENLLAAGNLEVTTTGSGVQANEIVVDAPLTWSNAAVLDLDAARSITIGSPVSVSGLGGVSLTTDGGGKKGALTFDNGGAIAFANLASPLTINGGSYTLVASISGLTSAIAANPKGNFALANAYDASGDGTYPQSPISATFLGAFEGLGNSISNLTIVSGKRELGLFAKVRSATLRDLQLADANVSGGAGYIGGIVGIVVRGTLQGLYSSGAVSGDRRSALGGIVGMVKSGGRVADCHSAVNVTGGGVSGGLVGWIRNARIERSSASGNIMGVAFTFAGGLVGQSSDGNPTISESFATGSVTAGKHGGAGGLIGVNTGTVINSYATGTATAPFIAGGLVASNNLSIVDSYSSGVVFPYAVYQGGLVGYDNAPSGDIGYSYWDTTTSGVKNLSQGAGNTANDPGISGLSTKQFRTGLPGGFGSKVWREKRRVNDGLPYLASNAPPN